MNERDIFIGALEIESPEEQAAFLDEACEGDSSLRQRVEVLLRSHDKGNSFLESPPAAIPEPTIDQPIIEKPGTQIGPYKLLQQIGEGGMGAVYMAEQKEPVKRRVALKIIKPGMDTRQVIARFEAERQALAMMDHPNIAKVLDAGATESRRPYFVMELVNGISVTQYCDEQHLTPKERLELFVPICQAVQHAHQKGIIHRDLKPSNVLVALHDGQAVPKVIDFGVAKATNQTLTEKTMFTELGQIVGTLEYMSPEQAQRNQLDIDTRSDIYSLGVLLYELLTGDTPFDRTRLRSAAFDEMLRIIREEEPSKPSTKVSSSEALPSIAANRRIDAQKLGSTIRGELDWIVMKALEKDRARRYETASKFAEDVKRYLNDEAVEACPPSAGYRFRKFAQRNKTALTMSTVVGLAVLLVVGSFGWIVRDRAAQQVILEAEVNRSLFESNDWLDQRQWQRALASVESAQSLLAGGQGNDQLHRQVQQRISVLELVVRLEEIRTGSMSEVVGSKFNYAGADREFAEAFRKFGFDPVSDAPRRFFQFPSVRIELAAALDVWASVRRQVAGDDESSWKPFLETARAIDPDRWRNELRTAWLHDDQDALARLADSALVNELPPPTIHLLCIALSENSEQHVVATLLHVAVRRYPDDFWINWHLGVYSHQMGEHGDSVRYYTAARALRPNNSGVRNNLGVSLRELGRSDEGIEEFHAAVRLNPLHTLPHANLGGLYQEQGRFGDAVDAYRESIRVDPENSPAYRPLVWLLATCPDEAFRDPAQAVEYGRRAVQLEAELTDKWCNLGVAEYRAGHWQAAVDALEKGRHMRNEGFEYHRFFLAMAHWQLGNQEQSLNEYDKTVSWMLQIEDRSKNEELSRFRDEAEALMPLAGPRREAFARAGAQHTLARSLVSEEKFADAEEALWEATRLDPDNSVYQQFLGDVLHREGKLAAAEVAYREAIRLDSENAGRWHNFGDILRAQDKLDEAADAYRHAISLTPSTHSYHHLASVYVRQGDLHQAERVVREAIRLTASAELHRFLSEILCKLKKPAEADAELLKAKELMETDRSSEFSRCPEEKHRA